MRVVDVWEPGEWWDGEIRRCGRCGRDLVVRCGWSVLSFARDAAMDMWFQEFWCASCLELHRQGDEPLPDR